MNNHEIKTPLLLDGATGTNLMRAGMPQGVCVEQWILENPEVIKKIQSDFTAAGSDVIYAPTFSANRAKLSHYGLGDKVEEINKALVALSKEVAKKADKEVLVAGDMSPTGLFCEPFGDTPFTEFIDIYTEQAKALKEAGADMIICETMMSLTEVRAALIGAKKTGLPVMVTVTVDEKGRTLTGADPLSCLLTVQSMGAAAFGLNCSAGPDKMLEYIEKITPYADIPVIAKPNAGVPSGGNTTEFSMNPKIMAENMEKLLRAGASIIGGCCGTTPEHIADMREVIDGFDFNSVKLKYEIEAPIVVCNESEVFFLEESMELSEPVECSVDMADDLLDAEDEGCEVILVHVKDTDDAYHFGVNCHMAKIPVSIMADSAEALREALLYYDGVAIIDSRSDVDREEMEKIAKVYGSPIV